MEPEDREFMQELTLRHERAVEAVVRAMQELRREIAAGTQVLVDLHETVQARDRALFRVLDRLA